MGMLWPTLELMLGCAVVLVLWLGGREVLSGQSTVRISNLGSAIPGVTLRLHTLTLDGPSASGNSSRSAPT